MKERRGGGLRAYITFSKAKTPIVGQRRLSERNASSMFESVITSFLGPLALSATKDILGVSQYWLHVASTKF